MPLYLVIGYTSKKMSPETATILYSGGDGGESKNVLNTPSADFPVRERYVRPAPNGGRRIDAIPVADEPPADEPPADEPPADEPPSDESVSQKSGKSKK